MCLTRPKNSKSFNFRCQEALAQFHTEKVKLSFLCSTRSKRRRMRAGSCCWACWTMPRLAWGDNRRVDLSQTMIFLTSNLGGSEITELMTGKMGFAPIAAAVDDPKWLEDYPVHRILQIRSFIKSRAVDIQPMRS
jgi:hypothetical protein